ncbi:MAG: YbaY family lipoprotein [Rhodobacteraceae bacterium]|nr:YbaY family lipoprotein [Paracoccaceae bacterium]
MTRILPALAAGLCLLAAPGAAGERAVVTGGLLYPRLNEVPPTARVRVVLADVTGGTARPLGEMQETVAGVPPLAFRIAVPADALSAGRSYTITAEVRMPDGTLLLRADTLRPAFGTAAPRGATLRFRRAGG